MWNTWKPLEIFLMLILVNISTKLTHTTSQTIHQSNNIQKDIVNFIISGNDKVVVIFAGRTFMDIFELSKL